MPLISVCVTTYNRPHLILKTIKSILNQTYTNFELLIVDDHSSDNTREYILENILTLDKRIKYFRKDKNEGLSAARNTAIFNSKADYIVFCDDDDELVPTSIFDRYSLMKIKEQTTNNLAIVYSGCSIYDKALGKLYYQKPLIEGLISVSIKKGLLTTVPSTSLCSIKLIKQIGGFDENLKSFVDHDFWLKMSMAGYSAHYIDKPLTKTFFHKNKSSMVNDVSKRIEVIEVFLLKWENYLCKLMSVKTKVTFFNHYRIRVIGSLAVLMLMDFRLKQFIKTYSYIIKNVGLTRSTFFVLTSTTKHILRSVYFKTVG